jgi:hypothetical protein
MFRSWTAPTYPSPAAYRWCSGTSANGPGVGIPFRSPDRASPERDR